MTRSLFQCFHARCSYPYIVCDLHKLSDVPIDFSWLDDGFSLVLDACQDCEQYLEMGPPVQREDRGL